NYVHYPGLGEEALKAFLGVPIIHQRQVLGVLVIYQHESRCFDEAEEAFLVTLSAQLGGTIAHALAVGALQEFSKQLPVKEVALGGVPGAPGIVIGIAKVVYPLADLSAVPDRNIDPDEIETEIAQFHAALSATRETIRRLGHNMEKGGLPTEERGLFDVYLRILDSNSLIKEIIKEIENGQWAQGA